MPVFFLFPIQVSHLRIGPGSGCVIPAQAGIQNKNLQGARLARVRGSVAPDGDAEAMHAGFFSHSSSDHGAEECLLRAVVDRVGEVLVAALAAP